MKALICDIWGPDCTNGGVSSGQAEGYLVVPDGPFDVDDDGRPVFYLHPPNVGGVCPSCGVTRYPPYVSPEPHGAETAWSMFGGRFINSSDSRFPAHHPLAIHDRYEGYRPALKRPRWVNEVQANRLTFNVDVLWQYPTEEAAAEHADNMVGYQSLKKCFVRVSRNCGPDFWAIRTPGETWGVWAWLLNNGKYEVPE